MAENIFPNNFWEWVLLTLTVGLMTFSTMEGMSRIMVSCAFVFGCLFLIYFLKRRLSVQPEIIIYFAWVSWSLSGVVGASNTNFAWWVFMSVVQMGGLFFLISGITALRRNISIVMFAIIIGGLIVATSIFHSGEYQALSSLIDAQRMEGFTGNPNKFAYHLMFVIFAIFYFWEEKASLWKRIFLLTIIATTTYGIIISGSRKMFLGTFVFVILWFYFCQNKKFQKYFKKTLCIIVILLGTMYFTASYVMPYTRLGKRFEKAILHGFPSRIQLYREGFRMIRENPVGGIGLGNFKFLSTLGQSSHSDFLEVGTGTGIIGCMLYFSIFIILWRRLKRIEKITDDTHLLYVIGFIKAVFISIMLVGLGRPNILSKVTWVFFAGTIGYTWSIERAVCLGKRNLEVKLVE